MGSVKTKDSDMIPHGRKTRVVDLETILKMREGGAKLREISKVVGTTTANVGYFLKKLENAGKYDSKHSAIEVSCCPVCLSCKIYSRSYTEYKYRCPECGHVGNQLGKKPRWIGIKNVPKREKKTFRPNVENCHSVGCPNLKYVLGRPKCAVSGMVPGHMTYCKWRDSQPEDVLQQQAMRMKVSA